MTDAAYYDRYGDILHEIPELLASLKAFEKTHPAFRPTAHLVEAGRLERRMRVAANTP